MSRDRNWLPLNALRAFEAVAQHLNFTKGAEALGVTQSAVSRQIQRLESLLNVTLFDRKAGGEIQLTDLGKELFEHTHRAMSILERSLRDVVEEDQREVLHVSIATSFAHCMVPEILAPFSKRNAWLKLDVDSSGEFLDIENTDYDLVICYTRPKITSYVMDLLWQEWITPVCSADLLGRKGSASIEEFLSSNTLIHTKTSMGKYYAWETWARSYQLDPALTHNGLTFDSSILAIKYALEGDGLAMVDKRLYDREINSGRLCAIADHSVESGFGYYLTMRNEDLDNERLQLFRSWIIEQFSDVS